MNGLYQVEMDYACYGLVVENNIVTKAPPIARWMMGKTLEEVKRWVHYKSGGIELVRSEQQEEVEEKGTEARACGCQVLKGWRCPVHDAP